MTNQTLETPSDPLLAGIQKAYAENLESEPAGDSTEDEAGYFDEENGSLINPLMEAFDSDLYHNKTGIKISLFGEGCLDCKSLVKGAEQDFKKCHFLQGNTHCPAQYFAIDFIGVQVLWESKVTKALAKEDKQERTNAILALVDKIRGLEDDELREKLLGMLLS